MRVIDLCAGTGSFSLVFGENNVVFANDIEKKSKEIYDYNFNHKLTLADLHDIETKDIPDHDILCCGFPCQSFSISGNRLGFNDTRSNIIWKMLDIVKIKKPKCLLLENVKNILTHDNKKTIDKIVTSITELGYSVKYKLLNTSKITGIPQNRERVFFVCFRDDIKYNEDILDFDNIDKKPMECVLEDKVESKFYYTPKDSIYEMLKTSVVDTNTFYQFRRNHVRKNMNNECPTLTASMGTGGHNVPIIIDKIGIRKLTPRECFNLQGFPDTYKLPELAVSHLYKLAGNSISVPIIAELAKRILKVLLT